MKTYKPYIRRKPPMPRFVWAIALTYLALMCLMALDGVVRHSMNAEARLAHELSTEIKEAPPMLPALPPKAAVPKLAQLSVCLKAEKATHDVIYSMLQEAAEGLRSLWFVNCQKEYSTLSIEVPNPQKPVVRVKIVPMVTVRGTVNREVAPRATADVNFPRPVSGADPLYQEQLIELYEADHEYYVAEFRKILREAKR